MKHAHHSKYKMFGRAPKKGWALWWRSEADCVIMHDVNIKEAPRWQRTMVFLEVEMQQNLLTNWCSHDPSLMNISTTRKSSNEYGLFVDVTSGVRLVKGGFETLQVTSCKRTIPTTISTAIPTVTMACPEAWLVHRVQWGLSGCQILVSHKQEPWLLLQWSTIEQLRWLKYSPRGPANMRKDDRSYLREVKTIRSSEYWNRRTKG